AGVEPADRADVDAADADGVHGAGRALSRYRCRDLRGRGASEMSAAEPPQSANSGLVGGSEAAKPRARGDRAADRVPVFAFVRDAELEQSLAAAALRVASRGQYVLGEEVAAFEREFADFCGTAQCIGVANGTDALEIALRAAGIDRG